MFKITIDKAKINGYITNLTARIGDGSLVCSPDNYAALGPYYDVALSEVEGSMRRMLEGSNSAKLDYTSDNITLSLKDYNDRLDDTIRNLVVARLSMGIACMVAFMWVNDINPEAAKYLGSQAESYITNAVDAMRQRNPVDAVLSDSLDSSDKEMSSSDDSMFGDTKDGDDVYYVSEEHDGNMKFSIKDTVVLDQRPIEPVVEETISYLEASGNGDLYRGK